MTRLETARMIAKRHKAQDRGLQRVFLVEPLGEESSREPIRLLEVVEGTIERGIEPISFGPDTSRNLNYGLSIIDVSPREFQEIQNDSRLLGHFQWKLGLELAV